LNDSVKRQEMAGADRDAPSNRITTTNATALVDVTVDADGNTPDDVRFVNDGRRAVRDGWADKGNVAISNVVVGDDGTGLSRSNTALGNQTNSAAVSESLPDSKSVEYSATVTQTNVAEVGLTDSSGTLIARAVFGSPVDLNGTVTVTLAVSNDGSVSRGVLTNDGQTAVRDVLADNSPAIPTDYAYGSDGATVAESDSALGNELVSVSLSEILIQNASTTSQFDAITPSINSTKPIAVQNDRIGALQSAMTRDAFDNDGETGNIGFSNSDAYNTGQAALLSQTDQSIKFDYTPEYDIPASRVGIKLRFEVDNSDIDINLLWDGIEFASLDLTGTLILLDWYEFGQFEGFAGSGDYATNIGNALSAGEKHTLTVEVEDSVSAVDFDAVCIYDTQYNYDFSNPGTGNNGGILDGPQEYPDQVVQAFNTASTQRNVTEANYTSSWADGDVSNNQYVELANDGSTFTRFNNATSGSVTFAGGETGVDANIAFSRYATDTGTIPATGDTGQALESWSLFANPDAVLSDDIGTTVTRGVVPPNTITGSTIREAGLKGGSTLLTRHELADADILADQRLASAESTTFKGDTT